MLLLTLGIGIGIPSNLAYATNSTGASSGQGVATSLNDKWVRISTSGNIAMSVVPIAGDGSLVAAKGTVNIKTNSGSGYQLYIAGSLYDTSNTDHWAGLYKDSDTANPSIAPVTATSTASALAVNQWGYAVPSASGNGYATTALYESAIASEAITDTVEMNQLTWKGVKGDYQHILSSANTSETMSTTGEDTDIYYGTRVNNTKANGNYANVIIYTAFIDGGTSVNMTPEVLPITDQGASTSVRFETGHESSSQPVTPSQIEVSLFDSANANATIATCDPSTIAIVSGHNGTSGQPLQFTCNVTRNLSTSDNNGTLYDVIVRVDKENNGLYMTYEHQDYWRFTTTWDYSLSFNGDGATAGVPSDQTGTLSENDSFSYDIPADPTKTNYTFGGWSDGATTYTAGNTITLTKASPSKTLTAVWNEIPVTYTLNYAAGDHALSNASSFPTQTATQNMSAGTNYTFTIPSTTPTTDDDYTFDHWTDGSTTYAPGATIALSSSSSSATLTAVWKANRVSFSDADATWCKNLAAWSVGDGDNNTYEVWDSRDGTAKSYKVRKLKDGNCWMVQNLALGRGSTLELSSSDSDITSGTYTLPVSSASGFLNGQNSTAYVYLKGHTNSPSLINDAYDTATNPGAYYSFVAATAGTVTDSSQVADSICPKGWDLPTSDQFNTLYTNNTIGYGCRFSSVMCSNFQKAFAVLPYNSQGCYADSSLNSNYSAWWSSSSSNSTNGAYLYYDSSNTSLDTYYRKRYGFSVRCLIQPAS